MPKISTNYFYGVITMSIRTHSRKVIENLVQKAVDNKPQGCTDIRIIDKQEYVSSSNPLFIGGGSYVTNTYARYTTNQGQTDIQIDNCGSWMYNEPANYILAVMGEYHPFSKENARQNQERYESELDSGQIDRPIRGLISPKWEVKTICEEIIANNINNIKLTLWFDENNLNKEQFDTTSHWYYSDDMKIKQYFCARITIKYGNKSHTTQGDSCFKYISWINRFCNALANHNLNYEVSIEDDDYKKWCQSHCWNDLEFDDPRFNL